MNIKKEKGSIAVFVLVALLFMSAFLIISYANNLNSSKSIKEQFDIINNTYQYSNQGLEDKRIANTKVVKGSFVEYNVSYIDALKNYEYSTTNGWRLLDYTKKEDGTYSNVKLISTGIPAKLYYSYSTENNDWYEKDEIELEKFRIILGGDEYTFYTGNNASYYALQAAAGMYYHFGDIKFAYSSVDRGNNLAYFSSITSNGTTYDSSNTVETTGTNIFIPAGINAQVRILTLPEVNKALGRENIDSIEQITPVEDGIGLYRLDQLKNVTGMNDKIYDLEYYWLASPYPQNSNGDKVSYVNANGSIGNNTETNGIRPIICLSGNVKLVDGNNNGALEIYF